MRHLSVSVLAAGALLTLALLPACSDYSVESIDKADDAGDDDIVPPDDSGGEPVGDPDLVADPAEVDLGILCGGGSRTITLSNVGDAALNVEDMVVSGASWELVAPDLPVSIAVGGELEFTVSGVAGTGKVEVVSDDPDTPLLTIPLSVAADVAPSVAITTPTDADVLGVGAITVFEASLSDDADSLNELTVTWESDVDGVVSTDSADTSGLSQLDWDASGVSSGSHTVTVTVTDTCGNSASDSVTICQNDGYVEDSVDIASWNFEGTAQWDTANGWVELTKALTNQGGTAFQTSSTVDADNVSIEFQFYASGGSGADGLSVTALDTTRMTGFVGSTGGGIGYGGLPGWSVEVDTYYNAVDPTTADHVSVHMDGDSNTPVAWATLPEMEDGKWHTMSVTVSGTWMTVTIDGTAYLDQTISQLSNFPAYVGFTAATGSLTNSHLVDALQVEKFVCEE